MALLPKRFQSPLSAKVCWLNRIKKQSLEAELNMDAAMTKERILNDDKSAIVQERWYLRLGTRISAASSNSDNFQPVCIREMRFRPLSPM